MSKKDSQNNSKINIDDNTLKLVKYHDESGENRSSGSHSRTSSFTGNSNRNTNYNGSPSKRSESSFIQKPSSSYKETHSSNSNNYENKRASMSFKSAISKTYVPLKDTSKEHNLGVKSNKEYGSTELSSIDKSKNDNGLSKSRSESSLIMLMEETKFHSKTKNSLITELRTHDRFTELENNGYSMAKLPTLLCNPLLTVVDERRPSTAKSITISRESSIRRGKTRLGTTHVDPYGNLMSRVENIFETNSIPANPELVIERKQTSKIYPEERLPIPVIGDEQTPRLHRKLSRQKSIAEQSHRPSVRSRMTDRRKFDYQQELDILKFKEEMEFQDSDEDLDEFSDNESVESLHDSNFEEIWSPPEAFKSLDELKQNKIFNNTPQELKPGLIAGFSALHKDGSRFDPKAGGSIFEWATSSTQWRRIGTKKPPPTNVAVPLGPKGYVDAAIVFAEKQMEAWEKMKAEMLSRTGQKAHKFKSFHHVINIIQRLKQLGMNPQLLNRVDKSTLNIVISIKLWKKRALDNRKLRNEPIRKVLFKEERDFACKVPPTIQEYILEESVKIIENFEKLYENFLGSDNEKTIGSRKHKNFILSKQLEPDNTLEGEEEEVTQKKFSIRSLRFGSFRSNNGRIVPVNDVESSKDYEYEEEENEDVQVIVVPNKSPLPPVRGASTSRRGSKMVPIRDELLIKIEEDQEEIE
ncbi:hypothetical protein HDV06_002925 [Boothiomyces sp. JEL0866]|nr:hypothetical protein HDV06_002925 [Boothiomyces sp. JEL0866]